MKVAASINRTADGTDKRAGPRKEYTMKKENLSSLNTVTIKETTPDEIGAALLDLVPLMIRKKVAFNAWSTDTEKFLLDESASIVADAYIFIQEDGQKEETESAFRTICRAIGKAIMRTVRAERKERASRAAITEATDEDGNTIEVISMVEDQRNLSTASAAIIAADIEIMIREHCEKYGCTKQEARQYFKAIAAGMNTSNAGKQAGMTRRQERNAWKTWNEYKND